MSNNFSDNSCLRNEMRLGYVYRIITQGLHSVPKFEPICTYKHNPNCFSPHLQNLEFYAWSSCLFYAWSFELSLTILIEWKKQDSSMASTFAPTRSCRLLHVGSSKDLKYHVRQTLTFEVTKTFDSIFPERFTVKFLALRKSCTLSRCLVV